MQFHHDGLTLWYGTEDAPAPQGKDISRDEAYLTVGVRPSNPSNRVVVQYRIDNGVVQSFSAHAVQPKCAQETTDTPQYFKGKFLNLWKGERVEYRVTLYCAGRQVPDIQSAQNFTGSFRLEDLSASTFRCGLQSFEQVASPSPEADRFLVNLQYLARVTVQLQKPPEVIGKTPEGLKINWYLKGGSLAGSKLNAVIRAEGGDWMTLRQDGIGILGIHATLETPDGALISTQYSGIFELGKDGYQNFLNQTWPDFPSIKATPRFLTEHPRYQWLNRLQCIGLGEVRMSELLVVYDLYAF